MAYHEIGHALVVQNRLIRSVQKIAIIQRRERYSCYTMQVEEAIVSMTKEEILNKIATLTGGRAEEVCFGSVTTGASMMWNNASSLLGAM